MNKGLVKAFKVAKRHVSPTYWCGGKSQFICHALENAWHLREITEDECLAAKLILVTRLKPYGNCVESYLDEIGIDWRAYPSDEVQKYRHRWLDALILEFSK